MDSNVEGNVWTFDPKEDDPIHVIVRGIEADVNAKGWGGHPRLGLVLQHKVKFDDVAEPVTGYVVSEVPMFSEFYENPSLGLTMWNFHLLSDGDMVDHLHEILNGVKDTFHGWAFVAETWFFPEGATPEEQADPENSPNKHEARVCLLCLEDGRIVQLSRTRSMDGGLDDLMLMDSTSGDVSGGFVVWNMVALLAISKQLIKLKPENNRGIF